MICHHKQSPGTNHRNAGSSIKFPGIYVVATNLHYIILSRPSRAGTAWWVQPHTGEVDGLIQLAGGSLIVDEVLR